MLIYLLWKYWQVNGAHYSMVCREVFVRGVFRYDGTVAVNGLFIIQEHSSLLLCIILGTLHSCLFLNGFASVLHTQVLSAQLLNIPRLSVKRVLQPVANSTNCDAAMSLSVCVCVGGRRDVITPCTVFGTSE
jgi:hypothetical protein